MLLHNENRVARAAIGASRAVASPAAPGLRALAVGGGGWLLAAFAAGHALATQPAALAQCAAIAADRERLACYDALAARDRAGSPPAAEPSARAPAAPPSPAPQGPAPGAGQEAAPTTLGPRPSFVDRHWDLDRRDGTFRLRPHLTTWFVPANVADRMNATPASPTRGAAPARPLDDVEAVFQLSGKLKVFERALGGPDLWFAYTQRSHWQLYNDRLSRPFRETNYQPELILVHALPEWLRAGDVRLRYLSAGLSHQSNGRANPLSRSWNRAYAALGIEVGNLALQIRPWVRLHDGGDDDNPDIRRYLGHGDLTAVYRDRGHQVVLTARPNLGSGGRGALQAEWLFALPGSDRLKGYARLFTGYGDTLIDYNWKQTTLGIGISLVDWQ